MKKANKYPELSKIKGKMREMGLSYRSVCAETGIRLRRLNDILNGYCQVYLDEAISLCKLLHIEYRDIPIFFALDVA